MSRSGNTVLIGVAIPLHFLHVVGVHREVPTVGVNNVPLALTYCEDVVCSKVLEIPDVVLGFPVRNIPHVPVSFRVDCPLPYTYIITSQGLESS